MEKLFIGGALLLTALGCASLHTVGMFDIFDIGFCLCFFTFLGVVICD